MRTDTPQPIRLSDYSPPQYLVDQVDLTFRLDHKETHVTSRIAFRRNPAAKGDGDLVLNGKDLDLDFVAINNAEISADALKFDDETLTVPRALLPGDRFEWHCGVRIDPSKNTAFEGLYVSKGTYCTQCEAEGFRKITFYPDRPDVLAPFRVRVEADLPVLLSNGNPVESGDGYAVWDDPHPKPSYLFALVAGDLVSYDDSFRTMSGRDVSLRIFVRDGDQERCAYAMDALKRSMVWDEEKYGREYDLDIFMIVAIDDFNMGAMENKGLNVFNSKYVLASPETATDTDYELIEGIIAHEYFHNWTGNRITCRDWFQLSLKEGLTVYRDQCFSADMRSAPVQRIKDVRALRARQFREDAGPLAHPVRPPEYIEINNFYTSTVYEKGAEVIRMLAILVGPEAYSAALSLYFDRHDGQACTIENWIAVFEDATGRDLTGFRNWYAQAGTPHVTARGDYARGEFTLTLEQSTRPTPGQPTKSPQVIPVAYGFLGAEGQPIGPNGVLELIEARQSFTFELPERPVPSLFRNFSAPVILDAGLSEADRVHLLAHDTDPFNKWEAGRDLAMGALATLARGGTGPSPAFLGAIRRATVDTSTDPAFRALVLSLPSQDEIATAIHEAGGVPDPDAIEAASESVRRAIADELADDLPELFVSHQTPGPYTPDANAAGKRAFRAQILNLITAREPDAKTARNLFETADNMTEKLAALAQLVRADRASEALAEFHQTWRHDPNVSDKWFSLQTALSPSKRALDIAKSLSAHEDFAWKTPNRFRALLGGFAQNTAGFHQKDGQGYAFFTDWLLKLDPINPQTAARMCGIFETWTRYDDTRKRHLRTQLTRIAETRALSKDTSEMVTRILAVDA